MAEIEDAMWEWSGPADERNRPWRHSLSLNGGVGERGIQQTPSSQPWREHGKSGISGGVHVLVCCCNEEEEELKVMLSTFRSDKSFPCRVRLTVIVETSGHSSGDFTARSETYEVLKQLLRVEEEADNESFRDRGYIEHSGVLDKTFVTYDLIVKGPRLPRGKRSSLLVFFNEILPIKIACGQVTEDEIPYVEEPDVVYILDADSGHPEMGLMEVELMWRLLMSEPETACLTCPVRPVNPFESLLASSQYLEQAAVWDHVGESYFALQTTCRGAQCMLKYKCLVEDGRLAQPPRGEGAMPPVLDSLNKTAAAIPSLILLDTSPSEGLLVLLRQRRFDVRSCGLVDAVTCVPNSWLEFYGQRRRWYAGSLVAVLSSLRGKETYMECARNRWIASTYALVFNVHLHSGLAFLPVLLAKGIFRIARHIDRSDPDSSTAFGVGNATFEWRVFAMVWAFLVVNAALYVSISHKQLWMWINVSSVLWMLLCLAVLVGSAFAVTPLIILAVFLVPLIVGGLNFARGSLATWACLGLSAIPYVLMTAVHSVLVLLYALSTLDSTEWGTRDVGSFDSGVIRSRARRIRRDTRAILILAMAASAGVGVLLMVFSAFVLFVVTAGLPAVAYFLKLLLSIVPSKLEMSRQKMVLGATDARPLSLRGHMVEMAPIHGRAEDPPVGRYPSNPTVSRSRKASMSKSPTEIGSYVTADEGTPSLDDASVSPGEGGTFFGGENGLVSGVRINGASPAAASARAPRREISGTPTDASGFASTVVVPERGGSRSGSGSRSRSRSRSRSPGSPRPGGSRREKARRDMQRIEGTGEESRRPSGRKESTGRRRSKSTGNSRSRSRSRSPSSSARAPGDGGSGNGSGGGGGVAMAGEVQQCGKPNRLPNRPPSFRSGFSGLFSSADGSPSIRMLNSKRERQVGGKPRFGSDTGGSSTGHGSDAPVERPKKQSRASIEEDPGRVAVTTTAQRTGGSKFLNTRNSVEGIKMSDSPESQPENGTGTAGGVSSSRGRGGHLTTKSDGGGGVDFSTIAKETFDRRSYGGRGGSAGFRRSWSLGSSPRDSLDDGGTETKEQRWKEENDEDAREPTPEASADVKANAVASLLRPGPVGQDSLRRAQREYDGSRPNEEIKPALDVSSDLPRDASRAAKQDNPEWRKHDASHPDPDTGLAGQSTSEFRDVVSDLPVPGSAGSSRQRHAVVCANTSARARAGSQDSDSDLEARRRSGCPSPATVNAILNSRIGAMSRHDLPYGAAVGGRGFVSAYNKGYESAYKSAYKHHAAGYVVDEESPYRGGRGGVGFGQSLRGIYSNLAGSSMMESEDDTESDSTLPMRSSTGVATRRSSAHQAAVLQMEAHLMGMDIQEMPTHSPAHQAAILEMEAQEMESEPRQMQTHSEAHQAAVLEMEAQFMEREPRQKEAPSAAHQAAVLEMEAQFMAREPRQIEHSSPAHQAAAQRMDTHLLGREPQHVGTPSAAHQAAARLMGAQLRTREPQHLNTPSAAHQAAAHLMGTHLMGTEENHQMEAQELEFLDAAGQQGYDRAAAQIAAFRQAAAREAVARQAAARQAAARQVAAQQAAARHVAAQQAVVRQAAARHKAARQAAIKNTGPQRNWGAGQSSVFETSGSSSSDDEVVSKSRGLRGVQVLDPVTPGGGVHRPKPTVVDSAGLVKTNHGRGIPGSPSPGTPSRMGVNMKGPLSYVSGTPTSSSIRHSGGVVTHVPGTPSKAIRNSGSVASHAPGTPSTGVSNLDAIVSHPGSHTPQRDSRLHGSQRIPPLELLKGMPGLSEESPQDKWAYSYGHPTS